LAIPQLIQKTPNWSIINTTMERCVTYLHSSGDFPEGRKIKGEKKDQEKP
jgi:hypothetical protein